MPFSNGPARLAFACLLSFLIGMAAGVAFLGAIGPLLPGTERPPELRMHLR